MTNHDDPRLDQLMNEARAMKALLWSPEVNPRKRQRIIDGLIAGHFDDPDAPPVVRTMFDSLPAEVRHALARFFAASPEESDGITITSASALTLTVNYLKARPDDNVFRIVVTASPTDDEDAYVACATLEVPAELIAGDLPIKSITDGIRPMEVRPAAMIDDLTGWTPWNVRHNSILPSPGQRLLARPVDPSTLPSPLKVCLAAYFPLDPDSFAGRAVFKSLCTHATNWFVRTVLKPYLSGRPGDSIDVIDLGHRDT